mmetsp:Transcript_8625/g.19681  ORF Transcript_8625/g.19681 Transcript_8625/m.19681 type:complete len:272 (+) Transcript_8625:108-923(+)
MDAPSGYEPSQYQMYQQQRDQKPGGSSSAGVAQLFARLSQEIEENKPKNCIHFVVDFLCKHYPEHLHGFASIWQMDPDLEGERHEVVNFFKAHKISTAVAAHFANAGYDTLDTLTTLSPDGLVDIEAFNNVKWLPGHKVRLQQIFGEISARVRAFREQQQQQHGRAHHHRAPGAATHHPVRHSSPTSHHHQLHSSTYAAHHSPLASHHLPLASTPSYTPAAQSSFLQPPSLPVPQASPASLAAGGARSSLPAYPALSPPMGLGHPNAYLTA